jgi:hypothetical protein
VAVLDRNLRRDLENAVRKARSGSEVGARKALELLAVHHHEPYGTLSLAQRSLRNRLRARGRQLGDRRDERRGTQRIDRLVAECAYEHWHRMLFARFLAENDLLIEPESGVALSLDECREFARERGATWLLLASGFAERMLPQIFRPGDPVLEVSLPLETFQALDEILDALPSPVFTADDSLGWVYQFWQAEQKAEIDESRRKIGADELPAVTQLFTEDYMVLFLLHNTLGAWWAGKVLANHPDLATTAATEDDVRAACAVNGIHWTYLRFVRTQGCPWQPAAGTFEHWPRSARDLRLLDPCMGSGHFLVFALPILASLRAFEEGLSAAAAMCAAIEQNLFGLEVDRRCTQIAAFNLAFAAWRATGYQTLPTMNLACTGLGINARAEDWVRLGGSDERTREAMRRLYELFEQASLLGSLIDLHGIPDDLLLREFEAVKPLLERALGAEGADENASEMAVTAQGLLTAARMLASRFTLVVTNVPYLGRGKQHDTLKEYCERVHPAAKADLSTSFLERCLRFCEAGTVGLVLPQNWMFLTTYKALRRALLRDVTWNAVTKLGPAAFEDMNWWAANTALLILSTLPPDASTSIAGLDVSTSRDPKEKAELLRRSEIVSGLQSQQLANPDARIVLGTQRSTTLLASIADAYAGIQSGDSARFSRVFWEMPSLLPGWAFQASTVTETIPYGGREHVLLWEDGEGALAQHQSAYVRGLKAFGKQGILISQMNQLRATLYSGDLFDNNTAAIVPRDPDHVAAVWAFCSSESFATEVRQLDQKTNVTNGTLAKVPFDLEHWQQVARERLGGRLPTPLSSDPTQWLFNGAPRGSVAPLQIAAVRLLGYRWPRQTGSQFPDCPKVTADHLEHHASETGIVCLSSIHGEPSAADRLRALLADAFGNKWSVATQNELLATAAYGGRPLEEWLRDGFFEQHCELFHGRPLVWHIWDGLKDGFGALINYHRLAGPHGEGRRTLEKLVFTYLGDWTDRQRSDQKAGIEGADARVAAAQHLRRELERILEGEPPYDLFIRWKPLHEQPIGWEPDISDGVRLNIRPFIYAKPLGPRSKNACILRVTPKAIKWDQDRGKEPECPKREFPWFWGWDEEAIDFTGGREFDGGRWNGLHYTRAFKEAARMRVVEAVAR